MTGNQAYIVDAVRTPVGKRGGALAAVHSADLDVELVYRFLRDTVWVAVRWYRPGGDLTPEQVADQYLRILLEGISR